MSPKNVHGLIEKIETAGQIIAAGVDPYAAQRALSAPQPPIAVEGKTATINVSGPIMKSVPWYFDALGIDATSTQGVSYALEEALADPEVSQIVLDIDSPGGTLSGLQELADHIHEATASKPVHAYAQDLAASAAYWIGSQASSFSAGRGASIGSVGVYTVVEDISRALSSAGIDVKVISSGGVKGGTVEGVPLTEEVEADIQREIDDATNLFIENIVRGRGLEPSAVRALATGQVWLGPTAQKHGLIDRVESRRAFTNRLSGSSLEQQPAPAEGAITKGVKEMTIDKEAFEALKADTESRFEATSKEVEELKTENVRLKALAEASEAALRATKERQKASLIAQAQSDGRLIPALVSTYEALAEHVEPAELAEKLNCLTADLRLKPVGTVSPDASGSTHGSPRLSSEYHRVASVLSLPDDIMSRAIQAQAEQEARAKLGDEEVN